MNGASGKTAVGLVQEIVAMIVLSRVGSIHTYFVLDGFVSTCPANLACLTVGNCVAG